MTTITIHRKAYRSKKSGRFFKFFQYFDDGWGKYEDTIDLSEDTPDFFDLTHDYGTFRNHTKDEIEEVFFTISEINLVPV